MYSKAIVRVNDQKMIGSLLPSSFSRELRHVVSVSVDKDLLSLVIRPKRKVPREGRAEQFIFHSSPTLDCGMWVADAGGGMRGTVLYEADFQNLHVESVDSAGYQAGDVKAVMASVQQSAHPGPVYEITLLVHGLCLEVEDVEDLLGAYDPDVRASIRSMMAGDYDLTIWCQLQPGQEANLEKFLQFSSPGSAAASPIRTPSQSPQVSIEGSEMEPPVLSPEAARVEALEHEASKLRAAKSELTRRNGEQAHEITRLRGICQFWLSLMRRQDGEISRFFSELSEQEAAAHLALLDVTSTDREEDL